MTLHHIDITSSDYYWFAALLFHADVFFDAADLMLIDISPC